MKLLPITLAVVTSMAALAACDAVPRPWRNTPGRAFHCDLDRNAVVSCQLDGACKTVDSCSEYVGGLQCEDNGVEVSCAAVVFQDGAGDVVKVKQRDAIPQENKHWVCSRDRASVLVCAYGFCSTEKYCKKGAECNDDCTCCKGKKKAFARRVGGFAERGGVPPIESLDLDFIREHQQCGQGASNCNNHDLIHSSAEELPSATEHLPNKRAAIEDEPTVVEPMGLPVKTKIPPPLTYGSCKENQKGFHSCRRDQSTIVVCDPADLTWKLVAECPKGVACCFQGPVSGTAFCRC